jgi:hypothetical protein
MSGIQRRKFLKLAGAGSVAVAAAGAGALGVSSLKSESAAKILGDNVKTSVIAFRAVVGMPQEPLPSYASYVVEGHVDLATQSGVITKKVFAGAPEVMSTIAFPGLSQIVRVTEVRDSGGTLQIKGLVDDRSQLQPGESPEFEMRVDPTKQQVQATFFGSQAVLQLEK